ncbi:hypothetical protein CPter91_1425 [Collimonas pratensis]|uniref:Uncharacterized protein n=1 Tax=Collimonas pratensis TaxID=279113 RepID=A0A127Q1W1_9BURK|nr:hypothetical protein CPter91_1425 [Collimonas pratensis]
MNAAAVEPLPCRCGNQSLPDYLAIIIVPVSKRNSLQLRLKTMELRHAASKRAATSHGTTRASSFLNKCLS